MSFQFRHFYIPDRMLPAIKAYVETGCPVGDFLHAVLTNDLADACGRADDENMANIPAYIAYLWNEVPSVCWGSKEKVDAWLKKFQMAREALKEEV